MFNTLLSMWQDGELTEAELHNAVIKEWITEEEFKKISSTAKLI